MRSIVRGPRNGRAMRNGLTSVCASHSSLRSAVTREFATLKTVMPAAGIQNSLRERGVRLTRQRRILLDLLDRSGKHLNAESLYQLAKEKDPKLNRVTVY